MNELNDILESVILDIENLQGALNVLEAPFTKSEAFSEMSPLDVAGAFAITGATLDEIRKKANKALERATFTRYHGEEGGKA